MANAVATLIWITIYGWIALIGAVVLHSAYLYIRCDSKEEAITEIKSFIAPTDEDLY